MKGLKIERKQPPPTWEITLLTSDKRPATVTWTRADMEALRDWITKELELS